MNKFEETRALMSAISILAYVYEEHLCATETEKRLITSINNLSAILKKYYDEEKSNLSNKPELP